MSTGTTRWWWLRHAPIPDPTGRITGCLDVACDTSETEVFTALAGRIPGLPVLIESGLLRTRQTAQQLAASGLPLPEAITEPAFIEQDFGHWQGCTWNQLAEAKDPDLKAFWADPAGAVPPGGESFAAVVDRVRKGIDYWTEQAKGRDILAVAHAGSIRAAIAIALDLEPQNALRLSIDPLSLSRLDCVEGHWRVMSVNEIVGG